MEMVFEIFVRTSEDELWRAIVDPETRRKLHLGLAAANSETVEFDPPHRLVQTTVATWSEDAKRDGHSRITWEIEPIGDWCRLTVHHDELCEGANSELYGSWPMVLSSIKTMLEPADSLANRMSLRRAVSAYSSDRRRGARFRARRLASVRGG